MRTLIKIFFLVSICLGVLACVPNYCIYVKNFSEDTIYCAKNYVGSPMDDVQIELFNLSDIPPYTTQIWGYTRDFEEDCAILHTSHLLFYFYKKSTLDKYNKEKPDLNHIYDKRIVVDMYDLKKMNYIITYPFD